MTLPPVPESYTAGSPPTIVTRTGRLHAWFLGHRGQAAFASAYVLASMIAAFGVWLVAAAPVGEGVSSTSQIVFGLLVVNLLAILTLAGLLAVKVVRLARSRRGEAAARLHLRFVILFSAVAVVPAILVALVFGVLVTRGVDGWFSARVKTSVEGGAELGRTYLHEVGDRMTGDLNILTGELQGIRRDFGNPVAFGGALGQMADFFGYSSIYILNSHGEVVARGETARSPPYLAPGSRDLIQAARAGAALAAPGPDEAPAWPSRVTRNPDSVRVLAALPGYDGAFLYITRTLEPGMIGRLASADEAVQAYREAESNRARVQAAFFLVYIETALLMLVGAIQLGMSAASAISAPVGRLVEAADKVAGGDLDARVSSDGDVEEIAVLSRAFNRMTSDLQSQQGALRAAGEEAMARSRFIETVLSGVSAGVIGLDARDRVSAINEPAILLLGLGSASVVGKPLAKVAPELKPIAVGGAGSEQEIDVTRGQDTRRLRVRASGRAGGELVLTFDDITRLVSAQRNAAWRDVARRIAHEIKNPLTPIQLSAERLRRKYRDQVSGDLETFDRCTDTIIRQVGDIGRMVDEFSSFARMPAPKFSRHDAAELLRQAVFAERVARPLTRIDLVDPLPKAQLVCDGGMVGQALTNILKNAGEAVSARVDQDGGSHPIRTELTLTDDTLTFVIEDDGIGLPKQDRGRLTEPYVTTREKGTGLGLAIVKRIAEDHGGELLLADATHLTGARVCLVFPLNPARVLNEASPEREPETTP